MVILSKAICGFHTIPIKIPMSFLTEIEKRLKIYMETEKSPDSKNTPEQKEYAIGITVSYYRAIG